MNYLLDRTLHYLASNYAAFLRVCLPFSQVSFILLMDANCMQSLIFSKKAALCDEYFLNCCNILSVKFILSLSNNPHADGSFYMLSLKEVKLT